MIASFFMIFATFMTLTTFLGMVNMPEADAAQTVSPLCNTINQNPSGECSVAIDNDGNCSPSTNDCNISVGITSNFVPNGANELKLKSVLNTALYCSDVKSSWGKANCLLNSNNDYRSTTEISATGTGLFDNEFNYVGAQKVRDTAGQERFQAFNDLTQKVKLSKGAGSSIDTDGDGDNWILKYNQDIVEPDNSINKNNGYQKVELSTLFGGSIDTSEHSELGFSLNQQLIGNDDTDGQQGQVSATNQGVQNLVANSDNRATLHYDTLGLGTLSQTIADCQFGAATCNNIAGNPTSGTGGQQVRLDVSDTGAKIDVDEFEQLLSQTIRNFENSNSKTAQNTADQLYFLKARNSNSDSKPGIIDTDTGETNTQSLTQSIVDSGLNGVPSNIATQTLQIGTDTIPVEGLAEASIDQALTQQITGSKTGSTSNNGAMLVTVLSKEGPSKVFIDGFDQYLTQTASNCAGCSNVGVVQATFEVEDAATFTLKDGSIQGLTQTVNRNGAANNNQVVSTISVLGDGTNANIGLNQQISNLNGANNGNSQFTGTYGGGGTFNQNCNINQVGAFTQASPGICS
jgi:hypothetical protein